MELSWMEAAPLSLIRAFDPPPRQNDPFTGARFSTATNSPPSSVTQPSLQNKPPADPSDLVTLQREIVPPVATKRVFAPWYTPPPYVPLVSHPSMQEPGSMRSVVPASLRYTAPPYLLDFAFLMVHPSDKRREAPFDTPTTPPRTLLVWLPLSPSKVMFSSVNVPPELESPATENMLPPSKFRMRTHEVPSVPSYE